MQVEISEEKEVIKASIAQAIGKSKYGSFNKTGLDTALSKNFNRDVTTEETDTGWIYEGKHNKYLIDKEGEIYSIEDRTSLKIGDYVNYTYDDASDYELSSKASGVVIEDVPTDQTIKQTKDLKWRVLTINKDGSVDLIADMNNQKISQVKLGSVEGYNFGVFILNDICKKHYSNVKLGIEARSFKIEDIDAHLTDEGITAKENWKSGHAQYAKPFEYKGSLMYPFLYAKEKGAGINSTAVNQSGIERSDSYYSSLTEDVLNQNQYSTTNNGLTITNYHYSLGAPIDIKYIDNENAYNLMFIGKNYWIASRTVSSWAAGTPYFGIAYINFKNGISFQTFFIGSTGNNTRSFTAYLCPIVTIKRNQKIKLCSGENNETNMHEIQ